jgi:hypothetical protein
MVLSGRCVKHGSGLCDGSFGAMERRARRTKRFSHFRPINPEAKGVDAAFMSFPQHERGIHAVSTSGTGHQAG